MSEPKQPPQGEADWAPQGPQLSADGVVEGAAPSADAAPAPAPLPAPDAPLELVERPRPPQALLDENQAQLEAHFASPAPRRGPWIALALLALVGAGLAASSPWWLGPLRQRWVKGPAVPGVESSGEPSSRLDKVLSAVVPDGEQVLVESNPEGADVRINGELVGRTPWAGTNRFGTTLSVEVSREGWRKEKVQLKKDGELWRGTVKLRTAP